MPVTGWVRSHWDEEDAHYYWEVGDDGWVTRSVELHGPEQRPEVAAALDEGMRELDAGQVRQYQARYGVLVEKPIADRGFPHEDLTGSRSRLSGGLLVGSWSRAVPEQTTLACGRSAWSVGSRDWVMASRSSSAAKSGSCAASRPDLPTSAMPSVRCRGWLTGGVVDDLGCGLPDLKGERANVPCRDDAPSVLTNHPLV